MTPKALSREIKFRCWDGERMKDVTSIGWIDTEIDYVSTPKTSAPADNFVLMQYTGLHDKNGNEIYESDILANDLGLKVEVKWDYYVLEEIGNQIKDFDEEAKWYVIGNIYENPELLTKKLINL